MKLNKIWFLFGLIALANMVLRFLQLYFTIDSRTGFFIENSKTYGEIILVVILIFTAILGVFSFLGFNKPENPPRKSLSLSISALILSVFVFAEMVFIQAAPFVVAWQSTVLKLSATVLTIYLVVFAASYLVNIKLPEIATIIPSVYFIFRTLKDFTAISKLAMISDNVVLITTYCIVLLFFINFAKLYNSTDNEFCFKKLLSYGLPAVVLCFTYSLPNILIYIMHGFSRISMFSNMLIFTSGIFILCFLLNYFSKKNLR